jgi:hypothetical protein
MRVKHVAATARKTELDDCPLGLSQGHDVGLLVGNESGSASINVEGLGVKVKGGDGIIPHHVEEVDADQFANRHLDRKTLVESRHPIPSIHLIVAVPVEVESTQDEGYFMRRRATLERIHDHHPIEAMGEVVRGRGGVAVIWMKTERACADVIRGLPTWRDGFPPVLRDIMPAVEMQIVGVCTEVAKTNRQYIAFRGPDQRSRNAAIEGPGVHGSSSRHLDRLLRYPQVYVFGEGLASGMSRRWHGRGIEGARAKIGWRLGATRVGRPCGVGGLGVSAATVAKPDEHATDGSRSHAHAYADELAARESHR